MIVIVGKQRYELPGGSAVRDAVGALSPFGNEPVTVTLNGARVDADADMPLEDGDVIAFYPLLIGG